MRRKNHSSLWSRRSFLGGLGVSAAALPFIPRLGQAQGDMGGKRFIVFATTTGMTGRYPNNWAPTGTATDFTLSPILEPLGGGEMVNGLPIEDLTSDCLFLQGVDMKAYADSPRVGGHPTGMGVMLTATPNMEGDLFSGGGPDSGGWAGGISIDQFAANRLGQDTPFKSVELGVANFQGVSHLRACMSYEGAAMPIPVESNPFAAFDRLFGDFVDNDPAALERIRAERLSVLDFVASDLETANSKLGPEAKQKVEAHLDAIREIEKRVTSEFTCTPPELVDNGLTVNGNGTYSGDMMPEAGHLQLDILVQALACGLTNVGSILWGTAPTGTRFTWAPGWDSDEGLHPLSHLATNNAAAQDNLQAAARWYASQFAYLCQRLKNIPEPGGEGSMLDNSIVLWCCENSRSNNHSPDNMPYVIAGSGGGYFNTGRSLSYDSEPHNKLFVSISHALGFDDVTEFGDPQYGTGPLDSMT